MIVGVHQPQYMPWLGYFDKINQSDVFILLDTVQFKKNEWQNRNKIKSNKGWQWLTVPVTYKYPELIRDVGINNNDRWQHKQKQTIMTCYKKAPHWKLLESFFEYVFSNKWNYISELNIFVVKELCKILGIEAPIHIASELGVFPVDPDKKLIAITKYFNADTYLAGSGGKGYMDLGKYEQDNVKVMFQEYKHPEYSQLFGSFEPYMSIVDLIFNHGEESLSILRNC